jgi:hypothetical protein
MAGLSQARFARSLFMVAFLDAKPVSTFAENAPGEV